MLKHLNIQNYALISHLDIDFSTGFSVITGETGAGKSIILGALGLLMGQRADIKSITEGEQKCVIEGEFDVEGYGLQPFFDENDLDYSPICSIRRELLASGKSRSFVNDTPITLVALKELSEKLIDIHSQHENLLLANDAFQMHILDSVAGNTTEREQYAAQYAAYKQTEKELCDLKAEADRMKTDADYILHQYNQLEEMQLQTGELEELEQEEQMLSHAEEIKSALSTTLRLLDGEDGSILSALREGVQQMRHISSYLKEDDKQEDRLESSYIELKDIAEEIERKAEDIEYDPRRLEFVQERLDQLNSLLQKHHKQSVEDLIALRDELGEQVGRNDSYDLDIAKLEKELSSKEKQLEEAAKALRLTREKTSPLIKEMLEGNLTGLGIAHANIGVDITDKAHYEASGKDDVQIMFAANKNQTMRRVQDVASGGEIARLMLCIKALIADTQGLPTIIFDEIDTGVSGEVASKMGEIMSKMSHGRQIMAITHLPQIAAKGESHYKVYKTDTELRTETNIRQLDRKERVMELAKMLSGDQVTEAAQQNAEQLLKK